MNRNFWVVIDSDRTSADQELNATKLRVVDVLDEPEARSGAWVTEGYTVETTCQSSGCMRRSLKCILRSSPLGMATSMSTR